MRKSIVRAFMTGLLVIVVFYAFQLIQAVYLSYNYVPEIMESYESVEVLDHQVAFGIAINPVRTVFEVLGLLVLGMAVYYAVRKIRGKKRE